MLEKCMSNHGLVLAFFVRNKRQKRVQRVVVVAICSNRQQFTSVSLLINFANLQPYEFPRMILVMVHLSSTLPCTRRPQSLWLLREIVLERERHVVGASYWLRSFKLP